MAVVSLRLSDAQQERLERAGISPARAAKEHLLLLLRRLEIDDDFAHFDRVRQPSPPTSELVRRDRESH